MNRDSGTASANGGSGDLLGRWGCISQIQLSDDPPKAANRDKHKNKCHDGPVASRRSVPNAHDALDHRLPGADEKKKQRAAEREE